MKIAIAAENKDPSAEVSTRGGRAPFYFIFDEKGKPLEAVKNPFAIGGGGAGFAAAKLLADKGVKKFIAGNIGPNMEEALQERGIEYQSGGGTVEGVIKRLTKK